MYGGAGGWDARGKGRLKTLGLRLPRRFHQQREMTDRDGICVARIFDIRCTHSAEDGRDADRARCAAALISRIEHIRAAKALIHRIASRVRENLSKIR